MWVSWRDFWTLVYWFSNWRTGELCFFSSTWVVFWTKVLTLNIYYMDFIWYSTHIHFNSITQSTQLQSSLDNLPIHKSNLIRGVSWVFWQVWTQRNKPQYIFPRWDVCLVQWLKDIQYYSSQLFYQSIQSINVIVSGDYSNF